MERGRDVVPGRVKREALTDEQRCRMLARMHGAVCEQQTVVWEAAVFFYETGTPVEQLAPALGMSVRSFYRRLAADPPAPL